MFIIILQIFYVIKITSSSFHVTEFIKFLEFSNSHKLIKKLQDIHHKIIKNMENRTDVKYNSQRLTNRILFPGIYKICCHDKKIAIYPSTASSANQQSRNRNSLV